MILAQGGEIMLISKHFCRTALEGDAYHTNSKKLQNSKLFKLGIGPERFVSLPNGKNTALSFRDSSENYEMWCYKPGFLIKNFL